MRIDSIRIKNFKGFEDETFHLNPRMTVFIGDNAKGKTAILNALAVATGSFFLGIGGIDSRTIAKNEIRVATIDGQPKPQLPVVIEAFWNLDASDKQLWSILDNRTLVTWKREIEKENTTSKHAKEIKSFAAALLRRSREASGVVFPLLAYYGTGRLWAVHEKLAYQKQEEGVVMAYTNALSAKASPKEFLEWYKTQEDDVKKFGDPLQIALLNAFNKTITDIIPDERWQDITFDYKENELVGLFTDDAGSKVKLKFTQLSDGYRNIVALAGDLAFRAVQLNPHLGEHAIEDTPGVVLIDEIDMHLHPNWQRRIVNDLKNVFPKVQFVVTTHSPFIVQSIDNNELINFDLQTTINPKEYPIEVISEEVMNVEASYGIEKSNQENQSIDYFNLLNEAEKSNNKADFIIKLEQLENSILNTGLRAFLKTHRIAKNIL